MEVVSVALASKLMSVAEDPNVVPPKPTRLCDADYIHMDEGEPPESGGGSDSDEPVIVPPASQVVEPNVESPANLDEDNDEGPKVVVLPPKDLTSEEIEAWQKTVSVLKEKPKLRAPPAALKRKWSSAQEKV
jgi:hypothetical protein